ncbi:MAG: arsenate reductase (glutaredoxin) [Actinobacteria bacterium]|nr:arsenate reductase (glutaredoxin) [Actinomycetota bacterium]|tara:strand:+ start:787 stop:1116 length:330 start_codon:yes stop_codon:yes gene_type:complete
MKLYHNPRCSKSRQALQLLEGQNIHIHEYLKEGLSKAQVAEIIQKLESPITGLIRQKELKALALSIDPDNEESIIAILVQHPHLLERPILVSDQKAIIGRPPENVLSLI